MKPLFLALAAFSVAGLTSAPALSAGFTTSHPAFELDSQIVLGRTESAYYTGIEELRGVPFAAKIDTGADTTSVHAQDVHVYSTHPKYKGMKDLELMKQIVNDLGTVESNDWKQPFDVVPERDIRGVVQFTMSHPVTGKAIKLERPLARMSVIRSRTSEEPIYRPVVKLELTIAGETVSTEVNLTDRSQFSAPILIGKTYLRDHAWVMAGYDYLQSLPQATLIGRSDSGSIDGVDVDISLSQSANYSSLNARNIKVKGDRVQFDLVGRKHKTKAMDLPLVRMLSVSGNKKPLVYVPLKTADNEVKQVLVYPDDRSDNSTQLRLGLRTQSELFVTVMGEKSLLGKKTPGFGEWQKKHSALLVSPQETLTLDEVRVPAEPAPWVKTSLLEVPEYQYDDQKEEVSYVLDNRQITKPVKRMLQVGDSRRPIVEGEFTFNGESQWKEFALETLDKDEDQPRFVIGRSFDKNGVVINTRAVELLTPQPVFKAGYIEQAQVEGMSFPVKLDTGADMSSMSAENIHRFEKDGKPMVRFTYRNSDGAEKVLEKPVVDEISVKAKAGEKNFDRPVIEVEVRLGKVKETIRVNLKDRSRFRYSMILGKNFLRHGLVVSSDGTFVLTKEE